MKPQMHPRPIDRRRILQRAAFASSLALPGTRAAAAATLNGLQLVVPTPAGSQPDVIARWLVEAVSRQAGVAGMVMNLPGAAGTLAADAVLRGSPENGGLLLGGLDHVAYPHLNSNRRAPGPFVDFTPMAAVNRDTWVVSTAADERGITGAIWPRPVRAD